MKKIFWSLAALMMMTAPVMTSCSNNDLDEVAPVEETKENVVTLTIAFPEQAVTRVAIDGDNKLTGWEEGDVVTLVDTELIPSDPIMGYDEYLMYCGAYDFRCTDPATGTFTGKLPNGTSVNDCELAFYNATGFEKNSRSGLCLDFKPKHYASQSMKDVVMMMAKNDGQGHFAMGIFGSILKLTNNTGADISAKVKIRWDNKGNDDYIIYDHSTAYFDRREYTDFSIDFGHSFRNLFTLSKDAPTYVYIPAHGNEDYDVGLSAEDDAVDVCSIVNFKSNPGNAKLFKTFPEAEGTAKAIIDGREVNVPWVRLWSNGPKFAEYNVGVTDGRIDSYGGLYCWGSSIDRDPYAIYKTGTEPLSGTDDTATNLWGSAWRMPTYSELSGLIEYCELVWITTIDNVPGYTFRGKGDFASHSIFLPAADDSDHGEGIGYYWSSTPDTFDEDASGMMIFQSGLYEMAPNAKRSNGFSVRAVLAN